MPVPAGFGHLFQHPQRRVVREFVQDVARLRLGEPWSTVSRAQRAAMSASFLFSAYPAFSRMLALGRVICSSRKVRGGAYDTEGEARKGSRKTVGLFTALVPSLRQVMRPAEASGPTALPRVSQRRVYGLRRTFHERRRREQEVLAVMGGATRWTARGRRAALLQGGGEPRFEALGAGVEGVEDAGEAGAGEDLLAELEGEREVAPPAPDDSRRSGDRIVAAQ